MSMPALVWARKIWQDLDTAVSLSCTILDRYKEYEQLVKKSISPADYRNPLQFFLDYQAVKLLSKYPYLETGIDRKRNAIDKFLEAEVQCSHTNARLLSWNSSGSAFIPTRGVNEVFHLARRKIASILGDVPSFEQLDYRFGPGASFGVRGDTSVFRKLTQPLECTFAFTPHLEEFLQEFPGWIPEGSHKVELCAGSELTFVPKDAKTDRPICIEPTVNGLYQKGVGSYIRQRLGHWGVNLRDQGVNQELARRAFSDGLCTVDFASASDTIAYMLVLELLPLPWVEFLDVARSPSYYIDGNWYDFHKFTSMGNAYTFELETLIFYALAIAACEVGKTPYETGVNLHVYGDDVVIPRAAFDLFSEVSTFAGFTINQAKSFTSGVFYESCGTDWYEGYNVRPYLLKKRTSSLQEMYYVSNVTLRIAERIAALSDSHGGSLDRRRVDSIRDTHAWCVGCIPRSRRLLVPQGAGDVGLHCDFDVAVPSRHEQWDGWWYRGLSPVPQRVVQPFPVSYALYHAGSGTDRGWWDDSEKLQHSLGYTIRNDEQRRFKVLRCYWAGSWDFLKVKWSDRAVSLVRTELGTPA